MIDNSHLYDRYGVTIAARERLTGGVPKNPELIRSWVESTTEHSDATTDAQVAESLEKMVETTTEKCWTGFFSDDRGIFLEPRQFKALFRECATLLQTFVKRRGSKQIYQHGLEVKSPEGGSRIYVGKHKPDGFVEMPIHVQTAQGPRSALKRFDFVECVTITFQVWVLKTASQEKRHVGEDTLRDWLALAQENGIGANRSQGYGKFDVLSFEPI
jgi:hypothetical protein